MVLGATPGEATAEASPITEAEVTRVLVPETHTRAIKIGPHTLELRPLPMKWAKLIAARIAPLMKPLRDYANLAQKTEDPFPDHVLLETSADAFANALEQMLTKYSLNLDRAWIEEHLSTDEIRAILEAQLAICRDNDFLLIASRQVLLMVRAYRESTTPMLDAAARQIDAVMAEARRLVQNGSSSPSLPSATSGSAPLTT